MATIATGQHLFPSRTEKLSSFAPMVLRHEAGEQVIARLLKSFGTNVSKDFLFYSGN